MRSILLTTLAIAGYLTTVASKFNFGKCPDPKRMPVFDWTVASGYADFTGPSDAADQYLYEHSFLAMDNGFKKAHSTIKKLLGGYDFNCQDLSE
jgi:hypothetical protein